jgi:hypothetical protein
MQQRAMDLALVTKLAPCSHDRFFVALTFCIAELLHRLPNPLVFPHPPTARIRKPKMYRKKSDDWKMQRYDRIGTLPDFNSEFKRWRNSL